AGPGPASPPRGPDHGPDPAPDHGPDPGPDRGQDPGPDHGPDPSPDHGPGNGAKVRRMLRIARVPPAEVTAQGGTPAAQGGTGAQDGTVPEGGTVSQGGAGPRLITARARLGDTARGYLGQDDLGCLELYADAGTGVLAG